MITADKIQFTDPMKYQKLFEKMHEDIATAFQTRANISVEEKSEPRQSKRKKIEEIPIWEKSNLTIQEAAAYSGIGEHRLRSLTDDEAGGDVCTDDCRTPVYDTFHQCFSGQYSGCSCAFYLLGGISSETDKESFHCGADDPHWCVLSVPDCRFPY